MRQIAIFVDAGYLYAAGAIALTGDLQPRETLALRAQTCLEALRKAAAEKSGMPVLRVYWYDGARGFPDRDQVGLALLDGVKLRLGSVNSHGQQKGTDSLIVTDLLTLARNHAIAGAMLLAGDEDLRVSVQLAQEYGVQVHLLGIAPAHANQSLALRMEADSLNEWDVDKIRPFLTHAPREMPASKSASLSPPLAAPFAAPFATPLAAATAAAPSAAASGLPRIPLPMPTLDQAIAETLREISSLMTDGDFRTVVRCDEEGMGIPEDFHKVLLGIARRKACRYFDSYEQRGLRARFIDFCRQKADEADAKPADAPLS